MQIVIDIPEELYEGIERRDGSLETEYVCDELMKAIDNGTPLPKGHGKLIDVNDLLDRVELEDTDENREYNAGSIITLEDVDFIPTLIPADKEDRKCKS